MERFQRILGVIMMICLTGCAANRGKEDVVYVERVRPIDSLPEISTGISLASDQNISPTMVPANPRLWQPAGLEYFSFPIMWLERRLPDDQVFVSKQVGSATLFCLIKPDAVMYKSRKKSAEYTIFLAKPAVSDEPSRTIFSAAFPMPKKVLKIADREIVLLTSATDSYSDAPKILAKLLGGTYELTLIYQGVSRSYADKVLNHFPWRAVTRS